MKMEEDVPTTIPNNITHAKPERDAPPNRARGKAAKNTVNEVARVLLNVSLIDRSSNS